MKVPDRLEFFEGRRGYEFKDFDSIPSRKVFPTLQDAVNAQASHNVAFTVDPPAGVRKSYCVNICGQYHLIRRAKKSAPWTSVQTCLATCNADAYDRFNRPDEFGTLERVVSARDWIEIQVKQHLKVIL